MRCSAEGMPAPGRNVLWNEMERMDKGIMFLWWNAIIFKVEPSEITSQKFHGSRILRNSEQRTEERWENSKNSAAITQTKGGGVGTGRGRQCRQWEMTMEPTGVCEGWAVGFREKEWKENWRLNWAGTAWEVVLTFHERDKTGTRKWWIGGGCHPSHICWQKGWG